MIDLSYSYSTDETPFIKYFIRLKVVGYNRYEIKNKLSQLLPYYEDMVKWSNDWDSYIYNNNKEKLEGLYEKFAQSEFYGDWNK